MDAKQIFEQFKTAKADASLTNAQVASRYAQLSDKARLEAKTAGIKQQVAEKDAEIARLKAELAGKGKAAKAA